MLTYQQWRDQLPWGFGRTDYLYLDGHFLHLRYRAYCRGARAQLAAMQAAGFDAYLSD